MNGRLDVIDSRELGTGVHLWRFGHFGLPLLVFPSSAGIAHEWEFNGLIGALSELIERRRIKLYCTESNVTEAWMDESRPPDWRIRRHQAFERYVMNELVPLIRDDCRTPEIRIAVAGTSLGGYYSANFALKFPEVFDYALCLSGRYDATWLTHGFTNEDVYFNNPMAFVPNLGGDDLERVRRGTQLTLVCGQGAWEGRNVEGTRRFADVLRDKAIPHDCHLWGHDVSHDWVWWNRQATLYLGHRFG